MSESKSRQVTADQELDDIAFLLRRTGNRIKKHTREIKAMRRERDNAVAAQATTIAALQSAKLQIIYLHEKFSETGTGNQVLAQIDAALANREVKL